MLLPLIIGPFVLVYEFAKDGAYAEAGLVGGVFVACVGSSVSSRNWRTAAVASSRSGEKAGHPGSSGLPKW